MKTLTFKTIEEIAIHCLKGGKAYHKCGNAIEWINDCFSFTKGEVITYWDSIIPSEWSTTPPLQDKQPVLAWVYGWATCHLGFYDKKHDAVFLDGQNHIAKYDNIIPYEGELPEHMKEAQKKLED